MATTRPTERRRIRRRLPTYDDGACQTADARLFDCDPGETPPSDGEYALVVSWSARAREICFACPIRLSTCLPAALAGDDDPGIIGGLDRAERRDLRAHRT